MKRAALFFLLATIPSLGQVPQTDIFLLENIKIGDTLSAGKIHNLTDHAGYDNQPNFLDDNTLLFTSIRSFQQSDIYKISLASGTLEQLTYTQESEYSPTPMRNGREFSVIRVEHDGTQRLWAFPLEGGAPRMLLSKIKPVGYHVWLDNSTLGLFVLGEPHSLYSATVGPGPGKSIVPSIGRGLQRSPQGKITFIHKQSQSEWFISVIGPEGGEPETVTKTLPGAEDFVWTKSGGLLMARESTIYHYTSGDGEWRKMIDLSNHGIKGITRLALSPDETKLAVVSSR